MNDIDDNRDELAFAQLDLARYQSMPALGVADVRWQFETILQDQHLLRRVGALFGVPSSARDGDQRYPTGDIRQQGRDNLSVQAMRSRNVEVCRIALSHVTGPRRCVRQVARRVICDQRDVIAGSPLTPSFHFPSS
jgi:hypothetical protein